MLIAFADGAALRGPPVLPPTTGLKLWLKADSGVTQAAGLVSAWADQSGNSNDVAQATAGSKPAFAVSSINGLPALTFGTSKVLFSTTTSVLASGTARSIIVVAKSTNTGTGVNTGGAFLGLRGAAPSYNCQLSNIPGDGNTYVWANAFNPPVHLTAQWSFTTSPFLYEQYSSGPAAPPVVNINSAAQPLGAGNVFSDTGSTGLYVGNYFGGTIGFQGDIAEILVYDHVLISGDIAALRAYLHGRYGV